MTTHTSGPWSIDSLRIHKHGRFIANCDGLGDIARQRESEANARLIAAAPELLAALQTLTEAYQRHFDAMPVAWQTFDNIANAAITKAIGE